FNSSQLIEVDFRDTNLIQANFTKANIVYVDFRGANLQEVNFLGSSLNITLLNYDAVRKVSYIEGTIFHNTIMPDGSIRSDG
ncbi:pentapeptide repeat-containing protein, partial [Dulcicalothrix desertica]